MVQDTPIKTALITGASSGIGASFARQLAQAKVNLVLVARREDRLQSLAQDLRQMYAIDVLVLPADLSQVAAVAAIFTAVQKIGWQIDLLINNAGYVDAADFDQLPWDAQQALLSTMLQSLVALSHAFLPGMLQRQHGAIIHTASVLGLVTESVKINAKQMLLYAAIKSFVVHFSQRLFAAYRKQGLYAQALCPGLTYSEFHKRSGRGVMYRKVPAFIWLTSDAVATSSLRALTKRKRSIVVTGFLNKVFVVYSRLKLLFKL